MTLPRPRPPPQFPLAATLGRALTDGLRGVRHALFGGAARAGGRPRAREVVALWVVQRLPERWHRHLTSAHGALPLGPARRKARR